MLKHIYTYLILFSSQFLYGQSLHQMIEETFNFVPHELSKEEQQNKFPELDKFFEKVITNKEEYIQPLRDELKSMNHNPYFYFDGGILLIELSHEKRDLQIAADALVKADLRDLPPKMYLEHLMRLSMAEVNVIDPALHVFDDPTFQVFIPQHAMLLNQGEALKFILPRYDPSLYVTKLTKRFEQADSVSTKIQILDLLFYASNCEADRFINSVCMDKNEVSKVKNHAATMATMKIESRKQNEKKQEQLRSKIRNSLTRISDEALYELFNITLDLKTKYTCG